MDRRGAEKTEKTMWPTLIVVGLIVLINAIVFRHSFFGDLIFLGDSDRLNTFLNLRIASIREILENGSAMSWNENMFMGFSTAGLHWINSPADPVAYILAWLVPGDILHALPVISSIQLIITGLLAFLFIYDVTPSRIPAMVGAVLYSLSVFSVQHISQADSSHLVVALLPLALYWVNKTTQADVRLPFSGLVLTVAAMLWFSFLQDVVYALFFVGLYAVFMAISFRNLRYLWVTACAGIIASISALPRIVTVYQELLLLVRTGKMHTTHSMEVLRLFSDGVFGRYFAEAHAYGNWLNIHEGLQLTHSAAAVIVILLGLAVSSSITSRALGLLIVGGIAGIVFQEMVVSYRPDESFLNHIAASYEIFAVGTATVVAGGFAAFALWRRSQKGQQAAGISPQDKHNIFGALILAAVLGVVLVPEIRYVLYRLFMRIDFTHSRISMIAILPMCVMVANYLRLIAARNESDPRRWGIGFTVSAGLFAAAVVLLVQSDFVSLFVPQGISIQLRGYNAIGVEVVRSGLLVLTGMILLVLAIKAARARVRHWSYSALTVLIVAEVFLHANFRVNGPHTETYPIPFFDNSFFNMPVANINTPSRDEVMEARNILETASYRSVALASPFEFSSYGGVVPHVSQFWDIRFAEGYSTGVPQRIAVLPWSGKASVLRSIAFQSDKKIPAALLAVLNVKYLLPASPSLYFNQFDGGVNGSTLQAPVNPYPVLPRAFFVGSLQELPSDVLGYPQFNYMLRALKQSNTDNLTFDFDAKRTLLDLISSPVEGHKDDQYIASADDGGMHLTWPNRKSNTTVQIDRRIDGPADAEDFSYQLVHAPWDAQANVPVGRKGRFVRIQATTDAQLIQLAEVEVMGCPAVGDCAEGEVNLAKGRAVRFSTSVGAQTTFTNDGDLKTYTVVSPRHAKDLPWMEIDLGAEPTIREIVLRPHANNAGSSGRQSLNVYVSSAILPLERAPNITLKNVPGAGFVRVTERPEREAHFIDDQFPSGMKGVYRFVRCVAQKCGKPTIITARDDLGEALGGEAKVFAPNIQEPLRVNDEGAYVRMSANPQQLLRLSYTDSQSDIDTHLNGRTDFPAYGQIDANFNGDTITLDVEPAADDRVMVLNELFHPRWRAYADGKATALFPVNVVMRGIHVPAGAKTIKLEFVPHTKSVYGRLVLIFSGALFVGGVFFLGWLHKRRAASPTQLRDVT